MGKMGPKKLDSLKGIPKRDLYHLKGHRKTHCRFYPFVYCIYFFGQCRCGFWLFCCCKTFEITEIIWGSDMVM